MDLNQFSTVDIVLDKANDNIIQRQTISAGDRDGRSLTLQVTNEGSIGEVPGLTANLLWTNHSSNLSDLSAFSVVDRTTSIFKIQYPQNMLTPGKVTAQIQLLHNGKVTHSKKFEIIVLDVAGKLKGVLQSAEYTALVEALAKTNGFETDIAEVSAQLAQISTQITDLTQLETTSSSVVMLEKDKVYSATRPIKVSSSVKKLIGNNSKIEVDFAPTETVQGGLEFYELKEGAISDLELEYVYPYYDYAGGLHRSLSGILVEKSADFEMYNIKSHQFPRAGIEVGWGTEYSTNIYIHDVDCSDNRSAGLFYGNVRNIVFERNITNRNGHVSDYGTGYGIASTEGRYPMGVIIRDGIANDNFRKGIDFHSGRDILVENNEVLRNRLWGIFATDELGNNMGNVDIIRNRIKDMSNDGSVAGYNAVTAIYVGTRKTSGVEPTVINIEGNVIQNINQTLNGIARIFSLELNSLTSANITLFNNQIDVGDLTYILEVPATGTNGGGYELNMFKNSIKTGKITNNPIRFHSIRHRKLNISDNDIAIGSLENNYNLVSYNENTLAISQKRFIQNNVTIPNFDNELFLLLRKDIELVKDNYLNNLKTRDWDGRRFISYEGVTPSKLYWSVGSTGAYSNPTGYQSWVCTVDGISARMWAPTTVYQTGDIINTNSGTYMANRGGTSGTVPPSGATATDGTVIWDYIGRRAIFKGVGLIES